MDTPAWAEVLSTGWQGRDGCLPQAPLASGVLTLVVQSFSHARVAAAQPQPLGPALLLQQLPAKALGEGRKPSEVLDKATFICVPSPHPRPLLLLTHMPQAPPAAQPVLCSPGLTLVYLSKLPIWCPGAEVSSRPLRRRCSSRIWTESRASLSPPSREKGARVRAAQLRTALCCPPFPQSTSSREAEPALFGSSLCQTRKHHLRLGHFQRAAEPQRCPQNGSCRGRISHPAWLPAEGSAQIPLS